MVVGRHHEYHSVFEQRAEKASEYHRVGDVRDMELVETDQAMTARDSARDGGKRIDGMLQSAKLVVDTFHERVEVNASLAPQGHRGIERVHQEALASADPSPEVNAARRNRRIEPAPEKRSPRPDKGGELVMQALQSPERGDLRVIEHDLAPLKNRRQVSVECARCRRRNVGISGVVHEVGITVMNNGWKLESVVERTLVDRQRRFLGR